MSVKQTSDAGLHWSVSTPSGPWLEKKLTWPSPAADELTAVELKLYRLLESAKQLNPEFLQDSHVGYEVKCALEFDRDWGLGSSSTLVNNVAQWAEVDPFRLSEMSFGGSGYDVMLASKSKPIIYSRDDASCIVQEVDFAPDFANQLWFVHLGKKQDSAVEVAAFSEIKTSERDIDQVSRISDALITCRTSEAFERLLAEHDLLLSRILARPSAQEVFADAPMQLKYLGAWGGDFMLAIGREQDLVYFQEKGLKTIISYADMIST